MQSSSDSSIWRSLAVAFGDGLAFGVGVKLTQNAARQIGVASRAGAGELPERLAQVEQAIKRIERAPAGASAGMDQKILEAIVNALEARLKEHGGQVERRLADLEAKEEAFPDRPIWPHRFRGGSEDLRNSLLSF